MRNARVDGIRRALACCFAMVAVGCAPALDWREFVPEGSGFRVQFPCRPDRVVRDVPLEGQVLQWTMLSCEAADQTFALGFAVVDDPARIAASLQGLRASAAARATASGIVVAPGPIVDVVAGGAGAGGLGWSIDGHRPDGRSIGERMRFFARGRTIYQAAVVGTAPDAATVDVFLGGLRPAD